MSHPAASTIPSSVTEGSSPTSRDHGGSSAHVEATDLSDTFPRGSEAIATSSDESATDDHGINVDLESLDASAATTADKGDAGSAPPIDGSDAGSLATSDGIATDNAVTDGIATDNVVTDGIATDNVVTDGLTTDGTESEDDSTAAELPVAPAPFEGAVGALTDWHTYQGDRSHSGAVALVTHESEFSVRWTYPVQNASPVTVSGARAVFAANRQLVCVNAFSGVELWSQDFSSRDSLSPPAIFGERVYAQTSGHADSFLWGMDARTGEVLFQSAYGNQWSDYLAPTVDDGNVYVAGGYFGGMYAFDAASGVQRWFVPLNQYDEFTPTVTDDRVFAYTGKYSPELTIVNKATGVVERDIADPNFDWDGWDMDTVAVAGSDHNSIAAHDGRLLAFDHTLGIIDWELAESFKGQPAVAAGVVYVVNGNALEARLETTGQRLWHWTAGHAATLRGDVIVTPNHVFLGAEGQTIAVSTQTHSKVWSHPVAGKLALAQGALYIVSASSLVAIDLLGDIDDDGLPDAWEQANGGDLDPSADPDSDGLTNLDERAHLTDPNDADGDDDGLSDAEELALGTDPLAADSDLDLIPDGVEQQVYQTNPLHHDTDGDHIDDYAELRVGMDPTDLSDGEQDSDGDGYSNRLEVYAATNRLDPLVFPVAADWGMIQGNARHDGYQPVLLDDSRFASRWSRTLELPVTGTAVGGGQIYLNSDGQILALDASDGSLVWSRTFESAIFSSLVDMVSEPSYANSLVYVHTAGHEDTGLWALDPGTGTTVFRGIHPSQWAYYQQPTIAGDRAYLNGGYSGGVVAMDALTTGSLLWSAAAPWDDTWEPAFDGDRVYLPLEGGGVTVRDARTGANLVAISDSVTNTTPVVSRRGNVLFGGANLISIDVANQRRAWNAGGAGSAILGLPAVGNGSVFVVRGGALEVFDEVSGKRIWSWAPSNDLLTSNIVVTASHVFVASSSNTYAVDLATRQPVYVHDFGGALSMGREGALFILGGRRIDAVELEGDVDADGLPQWWERKYGGDLAPGDDLDSDGLIASDELAQNTDPRDADSDGDSLSDGFEVDLGTSPLRPDSDADGLDDNQEVNTYGCSPTAEDTDRDGVSDGAEVFAGLDPLVDDAAQDADSDGFANAHEVFARSNPHDEQSTPEASDWGMVQGNSRHDGYQPLVTDPQRFNAGSSIALAGPTSPAAVSDRMVYVTNNHQLMAFALDDGALGWSFAFSQGQYLSTISGPSYANERVYVHTGGQQSTALWAFEPDEGAFVFSAPHGAQWPVYSAPTLYEDRAFMNGGYFGGMLAMDAFYGTTLWSTTSPWEDYWEPAVDATGVYLVDKGDLQVLDLATGSTRFSIDSALATVTPVLGQHDNVVLAGTNLVSLDLRSRREAWRSRFAGMSPYGHPVVGNGRVMALRDGRLEVFSEVSGERLWTLYVNGDQLTSNLVLTATHVFAASSSETYAIDLATRDVTWSHPRGGALALGPKGHLVIVGGEAIDIVTTQP